MTLTPAQQAEVVRLMPYAAKIARDLRARDEDMVAEAHLLLCQAVAACPLAVAIDRRAWVGDYVAKRLVNYIERQMKGHHDTKQRLGYTPPRPLSVHDVIARLPAHLQHVALARWTEKNRRMPWVKVAQELQLPVPECRRLLSEARDRARVILNDEATSDVLADYPDDQDAG